MATLREVRQRIVSVKSTQKITKAMKMVAAAKMRRAQEAIIAARPYSKKMREILQQLSSVQSEGNPYFTSRPVERVAIVVVAADRGLCGAFNSNIMKTASQHIEKKYGDLNRAGKVQLFCVGKKSFDFFSKRNYEVAGKQIGIFSSLKYETALSLSQELIQGFLNGEFDVVEVIYNEFKSIISQKTVIEQFLPIASQVEKKETKHESQSDLYIYEPDKEKILDKLIPQHLNFHTWKILLESNAAEQAARMTAMDNASTNAEDLISSLQLSYNKARQGAITKELLEIVGGAEALAQAGG
ncbi:MAG: ATP synthase F1 subunit gamma [Ignavibacteriales bacterium]|nr:ATP synthase F1 subunit gamma [Ignavibacteriales bacterium]